MARDFASTRLERVAFYARRHLEFVIHQTVREHLVCTNFAICFLGAVLVSPYRCIVTLIPFSLVSIRFHRINSRCALYSLFQRLDTIEQF
jgi:hypothetical protein